MGPPKEIQDQPDTGAVIRNNKGEILHITAGNLGHNTNNSAEVWGLLVDFKRQ
jgi:hypothetical protein